MLSAFQLENNRLTRLEVEESQPLVNAVWIDLVEPDDDERLRVQSELGQSLATRPELEDIEASARFFEDDDGLQRVYRVGNWSRRVKSCEISNPCCRITNPCSRR